MKGSQSSTAGLSEDSAATRRDEHRGHLDQWKKTSPPSAVVLFVLDYHLLRDAECKDPPPGLRWPTEDRSGPVSGFDVYNFNYSVPATPNVEEFLSPTSLRERADSLLQQSVDTMSLYDKKMPVIMVGYGYGGLVCEQTALLLRREEINLCGIVLMGTPHFRAGLAQWADICTKKRDREFFAKDTITAIVDIQDKFCETFGAGRARVNVACCFAQRQDTSKGTCQTISPEWCILSGFRATAIRATYSEMTTLAPVVEYAAVDRLVGTWIQDKTALMVPKTGLKIPDSDSMSVRTSASIMSNSPSSRRVSWTYYRDGQVSSDVTVGSIVKSKKDMELLAKASDIESCGIDRKSPVSNSRDLFGQRSHAASRPDPRGTIDRNPTEELNPKCVAEYANRAVRLPDVKEYLSKGETAFLVVGTTTRLYGSSMGANDRALSTRTPVSAPTSPVPGTPSTHDQHAWVKGFRLRPVRATSSHDVRLTAV